MNIKLEIANTDLENIICKQIRKVNINIKTNFNIV